MFDFSAVKRAGGLLGPAFSLAAGRRRGRPGPGLLLPFCLFAAILGWGQLLGAQTEGGGPGYEWGPPVPPPDLGPAPFAPPLPPAADKAGGKAADAPPAALELPPALSDALSIYPSASQASMPKALADIEGWGPVFEARDVDLLKGFRLKADRSGKLGWSLGDEISGRGLEPDESGRLIRLTLDEGGLEGELELSGAESLREIKSLGNPHIALKLSSLPALTVLTVQGAELGALEPETLAALPSLSVLNLSRNRIERIAPTAFSGLARLDILNLSENGLRDIDKKFWASLPGLSDLNLSGNRLAELPRGTFAPLTRLVSLNLSGNRLREIGAGSFQGLGGLENLRLDHNRLDRVERGAFTGLGALKYLHLAGNRLASFEPQLVTGLDRLMEIDLQGNCLPLGRMKNLQDRVPGGAYLRLRGQEQVYFAFRVQVLPKNDSFSVPASDAIINGRPSRLELVEGDPEGAEYHPPENPGQAGRLVFKCPGLYRLKLSNPELSDDPEVSAATGHILVVEDFPDLAEAAEFLGSRELARGLIEGLNRRGYVEAPAADPKRISAIKALFENRRP